MYKGKIVLKGLFLSIDTYHNDKARFVKNELFHSVIANDIVLYSVKDGYVTLEKIVYRDIIYTIGILSNYVKASNKYIFHTPLLSRNFVCTIDGNYVNQNRFPMNYGNRYVIKIMKNYNSLIQYYGHISERHYDHQILIDLYKSSHIFPAPTYSLDMEKSSNQGYYMKDGVVDLTHLNTFNIDPKQSKDFDDALSVNVDEKKVYVHIVDANQIELKSITECRMAQLGLTLYTHLENCNILPNQLSEHQFSLIKGEPRKVITVEMEIDNTQEFNNGKLPVKSYSIYKSIIVVKTRYNYDDVLEVENPELNYLRHITEKYYKRRLNITQPLYNVDHMGNLLSIEYEDMNSWSHRLVEMMMINANRIVTEHMKGLNVLIPERIHPKPILELTPVTGDELIDGIIMIQKYRTALYDEKKSGHYGLNLEHYTHFTSPIRRYNDVVVMRMMDGYVYKDLDKLLEHINSREELNSNYEKLYKRWKLLGYLENELNSGKVYEGYVTNLTPQGFKFYIKSIGYDGFMRGVYQNLNIGDKVRLECKKISYVSFDDVEWYMGMNIN